MIGPQILSDEWCSEPGCIEPCVTVDPTGACWCEDHKPKENTP